MNPVHVVSTIPSLRRSVHPMANIVVLVKQVPDTNAKIVVSGDRVDLSAVKKVMSPYDEFAVETALKHREATGGEVTALTLGGAGADKVLKDAKAIGVDHIVRIDNEAEHDSNALQAALVSVLNELGAEVVYCGKSAADTGAASTGPGIAERLGWASVSNVTSVAFDGGLTVVAPSEGGDARLSVPMPAVISCDKGNMKVRKPNVKGIMQAKKAKVEVKTVAMEPSSVSIVTHSMPPAKPAGKSYEGGAAAAEVARLLRDEANVI
jgi:electron transfer flavoprotein beta subunit